MLLGDRTSGISSQLNTYLRGAFIAKKLGEPHVPVEIVVAKLHEPTSNDLPHLSPQQDSSI